MAHAAALLQTEWTAAKTHWNDAASRQFEEQHLREIPARLQLFVAAVQRFAAAVERAERDCGDEPASGSGATLGRGE
jgi:hypothetical protein